MSEHKMQYRITSRMEEVEVKRESIGSCDGIQDRMRKTLSKVSNESVFQI